MFCKNCQVAICSKCAIQNHRGHILDDLETIYSERFNVFLDKIYKIHQDFLPTSQNMQKDIKEDVQKMKIFMNEIRTSMKTEAESLKHLVDEVISEKIKHVNKMEESITEELQNQIKTYEEYDISLGYRVQSFNCTMSSNGVQYNPVILSPLEHIEIKPVPETTKPIYPEYIAGQYSKNDVTKLLCRLRDPNTKPETRKIKPTETKVTELKPTGNQMKQKKEKYVLKQTPSLSSSVTFLREYLLSSVHNTNHISLDKSGRLWLSDEFGSLVQIDLMGNQLHEIQTSGENESGGVPHSHTRRQFDCCRTR